MRDCFLYEHMKQQHEIEFFSGLIGVVVTSFVLEYHSVPIPPTGQGMWSQVNEAIGPSDHQLQVGLLLMVRIVDFYRKRMQQRKVRCSPENRNFRYGRICHSDVIQRFLFESDSCKFIYTTSFWNNNRFFYTKIQCKFFVTEENSAKVFTQIPHSTLSQQVTGVHMCVHFEEKSHWPIWLNGAWGQLFRFLPGCLAITVVAAIARGLGSEHRFLAEGGNGAKRFPMRSVRWGGWNLRMTQPIVDDFGHFRSTILLPNRPHFLRGFV